MPDLEQQLNDFDPAVRRAALEQLAARESAAPPKTNRVNIHSHTFFSYNGYGYSPTAFAWHAHKQGLAVAGIVDFDVLDGVDEFHKAARTLGLKSTAGLETRVFIPEFRDNVINSPGEPGIAYHMASGFASSHRGDQAMLTRLKAIAQDRNRSIIERVNPYLAPVEVNYEADLLPLAPAGNPTERHLCAAYQAKAEAVFINQDERVLFWADKLGRDADAVRAIIDDPPALQALIRAKTMKAGGVGYVQPDADTFPPLDEFNQFALDAGAIPTATWLDGTSPGEQDIEQLLDIEMAGGVAAINIIPDRNWNIADPDVKQRKVTELDRIVAIAESRGLPIFVGTEMNAYGQRFVDDFDAPELAKHAPLFLKGAHILYAHTILEPLGMGYLSSWAADHFTSTDQKNAFFAEFGERHEPAQDLRLPESSELMRPTRLLEALV